MVILGAWLLIAGYWLAYDGLRKWTGFSATPGPTTSKSGDITVPLPGGVTAQITNDCSPHPGDTKLPGGFIMRPAPRSVIPGDFTLVGPC